MAWKHLTRDSVSYYVNLEEIAYLQAGDGYTYIVFSAPRKDGMLTITVDQGAHEILSNEDLS